MNKNVNINDNLLYLSKEENNTFLNVFNKKSEKINSILVENEKDTLKWIAKFNPPVTTEELENNKIYNSLLNNSDLIEFAKNKGYKIVFKPHPNVYKFMNQFNKHKDVEFDYNRKYNEIFNNASLIITDYSSIAFDFAYLKKPIIYYHYANDYHFNLDESYFDYEKMGFGEIVNNEKDIVDLIKEYINSNCKMKEKYARRVDSFFKYNDKNNCKRVYNSIKNL